MPLFLAHFRLDADKAPQISLGEEMYALSEDLYLVRSERSQSRVYHALKRQIPADTPLIVATLADNPKFKGMAEGALKWVRSATAA